MIVTLDWPDILPPGWYALEDQGWGVPFSQQNSQLDRQSTDATLASSERAVKAQRNNFQKGFA
jgi:hypothetical protein